MSYSSNSEHNRWVLRLAERLASHGIYVVFDQWDVGVGSDLGFFMSQGLKGTDRVVMVCSSAYVAKADAGVRGVGFETKIMTAQMLSDARSDHVVPVIRDNNGPTLVRTFVGSARYVDFRDDSAWDASCSELVRGLYGITPSRRPPLGPNPFAAGDDVLGAQAANFDVTKFSNSAPEGECEYAYEDNNGKFKVGEGEFGFTVMVTGANRNVIVYNDPEDIATVALAAESTLESLGPPESYDGSSRYRRAIVGDSFILINQNGWSAAFEVLSVTERATSHDGVPRFRFRYRIATKG